MVSSARQTISCTFLVLAIVVCIHAQTNTQKVANASISGKVTIKGKPAAGVTVLAIESNYRSNPMMSRHRARTDQTGSYRVTNLPAGTYNISSITPALVLANESDSVVINGDEEVENFN